MEFLVPPHRIGMKRYFTLVWLCLALGAAGQFPYNMGYFHLQLVKPVGVDTTQIQVGVVGQPQCKFKITNYQGETISYLLFKENYPVYRDSLYTGYIIAPGYDTTYYPLSAGMQYAKLIPKGEQYIYINNTRQAAYFNDSTLAIDSYDYSRQGIGAKVDSFCVANNFEKAYLAQTCGEYWGNAGTGFYVFKKKTGPYTAQNLADLRSITNYQSSGTPVALYNTQDKVFGMGSFVLVNNIVAFTTAATLNADLVNKYVATLPHVKSINKPEFMYGGSRMAVVEFDNTLTLTQLNALLDRIIKEGTFVAAQLYGIATHACLD